jgi:hypothetical protein
MDKNNIVSLVQVRAKAELDKKRKSYQRYLKSIKDDQIEHEVDYLLRGSDQVGDDLMMMSHLILEEISSRTTGEVKHEISQMSSQLKEKIELPLN